MEKNTDPGPGSGINIPDLVFENLVSAFWVKIFTVNSFMRIRIRDLVNPGSGIRDGKSRIRNTATEYSKTKPPYAPYNNIQKIHNEL
jgi:hypothetical protein